MHLEDIGSDQLPDLILSHSIQGEEPDAARVPGVRIVDDALVDVVGQVHGSRLPTCELVVYQVGLLLGRVLQGDKEIILLAVIVREDCLLREGLILIWREEGQVVGLVAFEEERLLQISKCS